MRSLLVLVITVLCFTKSSEATAQSTKQAIRDFNAENYNKNKKIQPLKIGDKVPSIYFDKILNYQKQNGSLQDLLKLPVILDFWFTGCPVCIQQFPKLEKLQQTFKDKITIFTVGFDFNKEGSIIKYLKQATANNRAVNLPVILQEKDDSLLYKFFPASSFPHEIWINKEGIVMAITDHFAVSEKNILNFINKPTDFKLAERKEPKPIDCSFPFFINANNPDKTDRFGSIITSYNDSLSNWNAWGNQCDTSYLRLFDINLTVHQLYTIAYDDIFPTNAEYPLNKKIFVDTTVSKRPFYRDRPVNINFLTDEQIMYFSRSNLFCYELILPNSYSLSDAYRFMRTDLDRFFNVKSEIKAKRGMYWELRSIDAKKSDFSKLDIEQPQVNDSVYYLNDGIGTFSYHLNRIFPNEIIVNNVGNKKYYLSVHPKNPKSLRSWNEALHPFGFELIRKEGELKFVTLTPR